MIAALRTFKPSAFGMSTVLEEEEAASVEECLGVQSGDGANEENGEIPLEDDKENTGG